jgi:hypothetical protein
VEAAMSLDPKKVQIILNKIVEALPTDTELKQINDLALSLKNFETLITSNFLPEAFRKVLSEVYSDDRLKAIKQISEADSLKLKTQLKSLATTDSRRVQAPSEADIGAQKSAILTKSELAKLGHAAALDFSDEESKQLQLLQVSPEQQGQLKRLTDKSQQPHHEPLTEYQIGVMRDANISAKLIQRLISEDKRIDRGQQAPIVQALIDAPPSQERKIHSKTTLEKHRDEQVRLQRMLSDFTKKCQEIIEILPTKTQIKKGNLP